MVEYFDALHEALAAMRLRAGMSRGKASDKKFKKTGALVSITAACVGEVFFRLGQPKNGMQACRLVEEILDTMDVGEEVEEFVAGFVEFQRNKYCKWIEVKSEVEKVYYETAREKKYFTVCNEYEEAKDKRNDHDGKLFEYSVYHIRKNRPSMRTVYERYTNYERQAFEVGKKERGISADLERIKSEREHAGIRRGDSLDKRGWSCGEIAGEMSARESKEEESVGNEAMREEGGSLANKVRREQQKNRSRLRAIIRENKKYIKPLTRFPTRASSIDRPHCVFVNESRKRMRSKAVLSQISLLSTSYDIQPLISDFHPVQVDKVVETSILVEHLALVVKEARDRSKDRNQEGETETPIKRFQKIMRKNASKMNLIRFFHFKEKTADSKRLEIEVKNVEARIEGYVNSKRPHVRAGEVEKDDPDD